MKPTEAEITKEFTFDAAHYLALHDGKCQHMHGHTYRVAVTFFGEVQKMDGGPESGMVRDFYHISKFWKERLEPMLDHKLLNESLPIYPSAEHLAKWIYDQFADTFLEIHKVEVWETPTSRVTYGPVEVA